MTALRAALAPAVAAAVTLAALSAWTATGQAGRPARIHVPNAWVMRPTAPQTAAYFTIANTGDTADDLLEVRTPVADTTMLGRQVDRAGAGQMVMRGALTVPAHGTVRMTPFTTDVMLRPRNPLPVGRRVPFTLVFRHSSPIRVTAIVLRPGSHD
jgi:copper(I)-binding protein